MSRIKVLVTDDNQVVRRVLVALFEETGEFEVVGEAADGLSAVRLTRQLEPNAVIMDANMPEMDGIDASRSIHSEFPDILVIGFSMDESAETREQMLRAGVVTCLSKNDPWEEVLAEMHDVLSMKPPALVSV